jgi:ribonuclease HI
MTLTDTSFWNAWFDGATQPNPGQRGIGGLLLSPQGQRIEISQAIGYGTNNEAEYEALIAVLSEAVMQKVSQLVVRGDSKLVLSQVSGDWKCESPALIELRNEAQAWIKRIAQVRIVWIPREENIEADALSVKALGIVREAPEQKAQWTTQTEIGKLLGVSAIAVGKRLDAAGFRADKRPTRDALDAGLARIVTDHFGDQISWHRERVVAILKTS